MCRHMAEALLGALCASQAHLMRGFQPDCLHCATSEGGARQARLEEAPVPAAGLKQELVDSATRQAHLTRGSPPETRRRRLVAWLQRRGHSWDTISAILKELSF